MVLLDLVVVMNCGTVEQDVTFFFVVLFFTRLIKPSVTAHTFIQALARCPAAHTKTVRSTPTHAEHSIPINERVSLVDCITEGLSFIHDLNVRESGEMDLIARRAAGNLTCRKGSMASCLFFKVLVEHGGLATRLF